MRMPSYIVAALVVGAGAISLVFGAVDRPDTTDGSASPQAGSTGAIDTTTTEPARTSMMELVLVTKGVRNPVNASRTASIVVYGTVTKVDPGRWNSPDGGPWTPPSESDLPVIYRTFYVEPIEILKGSPKWGVPVAFMVTGGTEGVVDGPVAVGDRVLVIGRDYLAEGGLYGNVFWKQDAYFAQHMEFSVYVEKSGRLEVVSAEKQPEYATANLAAIRSALQEAAGAPQ